MAVDAKGVFQTAEVFRASSQILANLVNHEMPQYTLPLVTSSAFSLELHLKCLILVEDSTFGKDHDLERLFSKITPESQTRIRACYEPHKLRTEIMFAPFKDVPAPTSDFDSVLHAGAKAFEHFRYAFEDIVKSGEGWMASPICERVRERTLELKPEWRNLTYGFNGPLMPPGM
jgi:hypothetical protein